MSFLFRLIVVQVWNSHHQTCGASGWKWSKGTGCFPPPPSGSLSRFAGTVSLPSDWSSRCSLEDRDAGARLPGNSRHGFGSIALLKILRNYCGNNKNLSLKTLICFWWAKNSYIQLMQMRNENTGVGQFSVKVIFTTHQSVHFLEWNLI